MCFNPLITWSTAALGITTCIVAKAKKQPANLYLPPLYFGSMEILQGLMYTQLDHPVPIFVNILVYVAYIHVCFQPLMINYWLGSFIGPEKIQAYKFTLKLCFIGGLLLLSRMFVTTLSPPCASYETLCGTQPTIFYGFHHIAWAIPLKGAGWSYVTPSIALHMFLFFMPGVILGFYNLMIAFFILGPYLSSMITPNVSEQSSIWCVMGLWLLALSVYAAIYHPPRFFIPKLKSATEP